MKRLGLPILGILVLAMVSLSCSVPVFVIGEQETIRGSGNVVETSVEVQDFSRVVFAGSGDLYIVQGSNEKLEIEAEENLIPYLEIEVRGDTLTIGTERGKNLRPREPISFYLELKELSGLTLSGSGLVEMDELQTEDLSLTLSGSGNIVVGDLDAITLNVSLSGSGNIDVSGELENQDVTLSGSGDYDAGDLFSGVTDILISGSGTVEVQAEETLDVLISGSGDVRYHGSPRLDQRITGSGKVTQVGE